MTKTKVLFLLIAALSTLNVAATELTVHAAASLADVLKEIGTTYEKMSGDKLLFNFGASSLLAKQIEEGAPADLFFSADEAKMDDLEKKNLLLPGTRRSLLSNSLVLIVPTGSTFVPQSASDLTKSEYKKIGLAEFHVVPAGIYAREFLEKSSLWATIKDKMVPAENVRAVLAAVASGNVDAGFVYKTDAMISKKVKIALEIPVEQTPKISYPIAVIKSSKDSERAKKLADFFSSAEARAMFEKMGFGIAR